MLRKLTLASVAALGLVVPLATTPTAEAHPPVERHFHRHFEVVYRRCGWPRWECYGTYRCFEDAEHAAHHLRERGFEARIRD
jgi:hypothetical protein